MDQNRTLTLPFSDLFRLVSENEKLNTVITIASIEKDSINGAMKITGIASPLETKVRPQDSEDHPLKNLLGLLINDWIAFRNLPYSGVSFSKEADKELFKNIARIWLSSEVIEITIDSVKKKIFINTGEGVTMCASASITQANTMFGII